MAFVTFLYVVCWLVGALSLGAFGFMLRLAKNNPVYKAIVGAVFTLLILGWTWFLWKDWPGWSS